MQRMSILKEQWKKYGQSILLIIIISLVGVICFKLGQITTNNANTKTTVTLRSVVAGNPAQEDAQLAIAALARQGVTVQQKINTDAKKDSLACAFVASRNSKKYHTAACKYGKKIKPSNLVCFKSMDEANNKGYVPAKGCLGKNVVQ